MEKLPIFVISDLHMGDGGPRDNFALGDREKQLESFLDYVESKDGELIILGDLFEFWQINIGHVLANRESLLNRFANMKATYVVGNHDVDLEPMIGRGMFAHPFFGNTVASFERTIAGKRFKFMHGHEVDPFNEGDQPGWGRMLTIFAGIFEDKNRSPVLSNGEYVETTLNLVENMERPAP